MITSTKLSEILENNEIDNITFSSIAKAWKASQIQYDPESLTVLIDSGIQDVRLNAGQEEWTLICNNSGADIPNGKAVFASGVDVPNGCLEGDLADSTNFFTSAQVLGLATHTILDGEVGLVTNRGITRNFDTNSLTSGGIAWLGSSGDLTNEQPLYPLQRILIGTVIKKGVSDGSVAVSVNRITRNDISKSYPFTSTGVPSGTYWIAGFYDFSDTSVILSEISTTANYGTAGLLRAAHAGIVPSGPGTVVGGQVGLRVTGIRDYEDGTVQQAGYVGIVTDDITSLELNKYYETTEKYSGEIVFELYVVSGTPTSYSLEFNYGFAKYDDIQDRDYTITGFEVNYQGNASSSFDIALMKHSLTGWTFAASGFVPGDGDICRKTVDCPLAGDTANGIDGAYKRLDLNTYIAGESGLEGHIIQIVTGANGTIQIMGTHVDAVSEELNF